MNRVRRTQPTRCSHIRFPQTEESEANYHFDGAAKNPTLSSHGKNAFYLVLATVLMVLKAERMEGLIHSYWITSAATAQVIRCRTTRIQQQRRSQRTTRRQCLRLLYFSREDGSSSTVGGRYGYELSFKTVVGRFWRPERPCSLRRRRQAYDDCGMM